MTAVTSGGSVVRRIVIAVVGLAALVAIVNVVPDIYTNVVSRAAIYGIVALSMNIIVGYTGQVSLGHAAFLGVGAFGAGYTLTELAMPYLAALIVAALTGAVAPEGAAPAADRHDRDRYRRGSDIYGVARPASEPRALDLRAGVSRARGLARAVQCSRACCPARPH